MGIARVAIAIPIHRTLSFLPLFFLGKRQGKPPKKQGFLIPTEPLKSLEKKGKTVKKTRKSSEGEKTRNSKKTRKGRTGESPIPKKSQKGLPGPPGPEYQKSVEKVPEH